MSIALHITESFSVKRDLRHLQKVSTQVSLRGLRRLTWANTFDTSQFSARQMAP